MNITPATLRVLEQLSEDPYNAYHGRQLAKAAKVSSGGTSLALRTLQKARLLNLEQKGRMKFYRVNLSNPVARQFKILFTLVLLDRLVQHLKDSSERVTLYGSCAEGTDSKDSDIDLFVLSQTVAEAKDAVRASQRSFDRTLNAIIVDTQGLSKIRAEDKPLYDNINRGMILWQRE